MEDETEATWDDVKPGSPVYEKLVDSLATIDRLHHLTRRRDLEDMQHYRKMMSKPDATPNDYRYVYEDLGETAKRLLDAERDPEEYERRRWIDLCSAASMIGSSPGMENYWIKHARGLFAPTRDDHPDYKTGDVLAWAVYAVECLLDALLMEEKDKQELQKKMRSAFMGWARSEGIRSGRIVNGQFVQDPDPQVIPFPPRQGELPLDA